MQLNSECKWDPTFSEIKWWKYNKNWQSGKKSIEGDKALKSRAASKISLKIFAAILDFNL